MQTRGLNLCPCLKEKKIKFFRFFSVFQFLQCCLISFFFSSRFSFILSLLFSFVHFLLFPCFCVSGRDFLSLLFFTLFIVSSSVCSLSPFYLSLFLFVSCSLTWSGCDSVNSLWDQCMFMWLYLICCLTISTIAPKWKTLFTSIPSKKEKINFFFSKKMKSILFDRISIPLHLFMFLFVCWFSSFSFSFLVLVLLFTSFLFNLSSLSYVKRARPFTRKKKEKKEEKTRKEERKGKRGLLLIQINFLLFGLFSAVFYLVCPGFNTLLHNEQTHICEDNDSVGCFLHEKLPNAEPRRTN